MTVRDVFLTHGKEYLDAFGQRMPANHKKVIQAIIQCRTPELGTIVCALRGLREYLSDLQILWQPPLSHLSG
jgi:hypothetical protein